MHKKPRKLKKHYKIRELTRSQYMDSKNFPASKPLGAPVPDSLKPNEISEPISIDVFNYEEIEKDFILLNKQE